MPQAVHKFVHVVCHLLLVAPARGQFEVPAKQACHKSHEALSVVMHCLARPAGRAADDCLPGMGRSLLLTACNPGLHL